jgi:hydroxyacylglutathione hydrolase
MALELVTVPCLADNYAFVLHDAASGATALVDAPEAGPVLTALAARGWGLAEIWLTHHHHDHTGAVAALVAATGARVTGAARDARRLPPLDRAVAPGGGFDFADRAVRVMDAAGHTTGQVAFHLPAAGLLFTGDSLMAAGCGRMFEGEPVGYWANLAAMAALPGDPLVCSGHEYTAANLRFALSVLPDDAALAARAEAVAAARSAGRATVPSRLSEERAANIFLRAGDPAVKAAMGLPDATDAAVFAALRAAKDRF